MMENLNQHHGQDKMAKKTPRKRDAFEGFQDIIKSDEVVNIGKGIVKGMSSKGNGLNILKIKKK